MILFKTGEPEKLLASLRESIRKGHVTTWTEIDGYLTHTPVQWAKRAWLKPRVLLGELQFTIVCSRDSRVTTELYAVYHGRFIEMMLAHFDRQFYDGVATAMPAGADLIAA